MISLFRNSRFYILCFSAALSACIFWYFQSTIPLSSLLTIRLTQTYALIAALYLYTALLIGPLMHIWKSFKYTDQVFHMRRAIGVSAFYFGTLHASIAFFGQLGGFAGLGFLSAWYLTAISFSSLALLVLFFMAATSFDYIVKKMTRRYWKMLHRFVYLAGMFIVIHALMLGTHIRQLSTPISQFFLALVFLLLLLESNRLNVWLSSKYPFLPRHTATSIVGALILAIYVILLFFPELAARYFPVHHHGL